MKIAFISSLNGGVGTYTIGLVKELSEYAERIDLYLFSGYKRIPIPELPESVKIITIQKSPISLLIRLFFFMNHLKKYDIIHLNYASLFLPIYVNKKIWGVPYIYTSHGYPVPELEKFPENLYYIFEGFCLKFSSKNADVHITISKYNKRKLQERYNVSPKIVYHGIDTEPFKFDEDARNNLRESLGITNSQFLILFVGVFIQVKNIFTLIHSVPHVINKRDNTRFLLIGGGDLYDQVIHNIKKLEIEKFVIVKKHVPPPEIYNYYSVADLFVLPSAIENFGLVFLEAMASGLPVVASNCSSCPEVVGDAGLLFDPKSSEDLANKIIELINNKELYEKLKEKGLERVKQFTWEKAAEQYYGVYKKVLEGRNR